jgi:hypothetical protein
MFDLASVTRRAALCGLVLLLPMCAHDGTETDNPVIDFEATRCKGRSTGLSLPAVARTASAQALDPSAYEGLYCYGWEVLDGGVLALDVINRSAGCYVQWQPGPSRVDGSRIDLGVANGSCAIAGCGSCEYDFSFEVEGTDHGRPAELQLHAYDCEGNEDAQGPVVVLPIDERPEGLLCRPQRNVGFDFGCGKAHLPPCTEEGSEGSCEDACPEGLVCVEDAVDDDDLCFTSCSDDSDCPLEVESCQDGACRLRETF